jgi:hypothetical protein
MLLCYVMLLMQEEVPQPFSRVWEIRRESWRMPSTGMLRRVALVRTDFSEEYIASIITVRSIG